MKQNHIIYKRFYKPYWKHLRCICCTVLALFAITCYPQDSSKRKHTIKELANDAYRSVFITQPRTEDSVFIQQSEKAFEPFAGKIIRKIVIDKLDFGENVLDTTKRMLNAVSRIANNLQTGTKPFIIRQMMFVKEGEVLDPYRLADNERLLRELDFVKDSRIFVRKTNHPDSVDIVVKMRDVFSIGGKADASGIQEFAGTLYDANLFGRAQRIEYTLLFDKDRKPKFGSDIFFRKYNMAGTFINLDLAYTTINRGISLGNENETSVYFKAERPLYTPSAHFAGGVNFSWNYSVNRNERPDSLFLDYRYRLEDVWIGYNIGVRKAKADTNYKRDNRRRMFASVRYYSQFFERQPFSKFYNYLYADKRFVLGEFSWYKLNFYKTNYIYGFGITEDIPIGFSRKIIAGYSMIDSLKRLYLGWQYDHWVVDGNENFFNYTLALGSNYYKGKLQDNSLLFNFSWFSRLFSFRKFRLRQYANVSYAGINNFTAYDKLYVNNEYGLEKFNTDSAYGIQRGTVSIETDVFTRWKLLGFKVGFFAYTRMSMLAKQGVALLKGDAYPAVGGGFRMRNENLIFGTVEGRVNWFPRTIENVDNIRITLKGNLRFKFPNSFVQAPWFAEWK